MIAVIIKIILEIIIIVIPIYLSLPKKYVYFDILDNFRQEYSTHLVVALVFAILARYFFENKIKNYKKHIKKLEDTVTAYQNFITVSIEELLAKIFHEVGFGERDRITLFLYSSSTNKFYFSGRYSSAPKYRKIGRSIIDNEDEYVYQVLNETKEDHYRNAPKIKNNFLKNRTMESNSMYGIPIWDSDHSIKIGVIIFQSMQENAYKSKKTRSNLQTKAKEVEKLVNDMKINPSILPTQSKPLKGF